LAAARAGLDGDGARSEQRGHCPHGRRSLLATCEPTAVRIAEWTQLVRSRLVLGQTELAQSAYEAARAAYPDPAMRTELDVLAADNGLVAR
jgi:cytochrome c-type biogenesis protein CcmH